MGNKTKRALKAPLYQPLLVYEINGENLVPAITGNRSFDYENLFWSSYYSEDWWFGHFRNDKDYKNLSDFKANFLNNQFGNLEKELAKAISEEYYLKTKPLAEEYGVLDKAWKEDTTKNVDCRKHHSYLKFLENHEELSKIDIRFAHLHLYRDLTTENKCIFYDPKPDATYEEVKEFAIQFYEKKKKDIETMFKKDFLLAIEEETNYTKEAMVKLLDSQPKVGLVFVNGALLEGYLEKDAESVNKFNEDLYTSLSWNTIYWFTK